METARLALQKACERLTIIEKPSRLSKLGTQRKSAQVTANEAMLTAPVHDFKSLRSVVESFESEWKGGQKSVGLCMFVLHAILNVLARLVNAFGRCVRNSTIIGRRSQSFRLKTCTLLLYVEV